MSLWSMSQALAGLLICTYPSGGAGNLPGGEASAQALAVGTAGCGWLALAPPNQLVVDSQDNLVFVAAAQFLVRKNYGVENNYLSGDGDAAACGESVAGLAEGEKLCPTAGGQGGWVRVGHTQDCDGWCEAPVPEKGLAVNLGIGIVGVGVTGCSFNPGPAPNGAVPAHDGIEDTGVVLG